jgi:hypothetical protein
MVLKYYEELGGHIPINVRVKKKERAPKDRNFVDPEKEEKCKYSQKEINNVDN